MPTPLDTRRYLTDFDSARMGHVLTDVLVVGSGVAGARAAIEAAKFGHVTLLTKRNFTDSCTARAQGGIAASLADDDTPDRHFDDTMRVGCGLNDPDAVNVLVHEGPDCIRELMDWGLDLDRTNGELAFAREGGHSTRRIVHANGDQTGRELARTLHEKVCNAENTRVFEECFLIDLVVVEGLCVGAVSWHSKYGHQLIWAKQTVLASGGCGRLWRETTNPEVATGDGMAAAYRAGASLSDMEMIQFHPTTLYVAGAGRALISEAVRGEGAWIVDRDGHRFVQDFHPDGELAPRDVVSRAIHTHLLKTRTNCVYLDARHLKGFAQRFPYIAKLCGDFQIDVTRDLIPVRPGAHYTIGGVDVDLNGASTIEGLLCCGEVARSGVHGANRIASNSLLEGLVFGRRAGEYAGRRMADSPGGTPVHHVVNQTPASTRTALDLADISNSLRSVMWRNVGIVREAQPLRETCDILDFWAHYTLDKTFDDATGWEVQNKLTVARLVAMSALQRDQSVGVHFRKDGNDSPADAPYRVVIERQIEGTNAKRTPLSSRPPSALGGY